MEGSKVILCMVARLASKFLPKPRQERHSLRVKVIYGFLIQNVNGQGKQKKKLRCALRRVQLEPTTVLVWSGL